MPILQPQELFRHAPLNYDACCALAFAGHRAESERNIRHLDPDRGRLGQRSDVNQAEDDSGRALKSTGQRITGKPATWTQAENDSDTEPGRALKPTGHRTTRQSVTPSQQVSLVCPLRVRPSSAA